MRVAELTRKTNETDIIVKLNLDGQGERDIHTGVGFFDHMLELFAVHGGLDLTVKCKGDLQVDAHHTVEDVGIALGKCFALAIGDKKGIERYAFSGIPMDEALTEVVLDISGRPYLHYDVEPLSIGTTGGFDCQLVEEFFRAFAVNAAITLHINYRYGKNYHHIAESVFKGVARATKAAVKITGMAVPSSKGTLSE